MKLEKNFKGSSDRLPHMQYLKSLAKIIHKTCCCQWKIITVCLIPLLLSALPMYLGTRESRCGYVILLMAAYWTLEPIPLAATSLLPIVLFPLLGVLSTGDACSPYMNSTTMMFVGGLMMAIAIEDCNLHKRIALNVLLRIKPTAPRIMLGFMMISMFLSMWISNTATAALMVPILDAILNEFKSRSSKRNSSIQSISKVTGPVFIPLETKNMESIEQDSQLKDGEPVATFKASKNGGWFGENDTSGNNEVLRKAMFLSVAYSTNIGGTGTITGTGPNLVVKGVIEEMFPESNDLSFDKWMMYNIPVMLICVLVAFGYIYFMFVRKAAPKYSDDMKESFRSIIERKHEDLGPMTFKEKAIITLFAILVMLWIFRDPRFITGWGNYFPLKIKDATPAIAIPLLMFVIPADPRHLSESPALMDWKKLQSKLPWGIIILLGGGFSLAEGSKKSGLSFWASDQLASLNISSSVLVVSILCLLTATLTEVTSNVATANVILPVVAQLAVATKVHPIYYMLPVTISCSFAFMLPVATPPNAIVFDAGNMKTLDMVKPGIFMNVFCIFIEVIMINSLGVAIFNFNHFPSWANATANVINGTSS